MKISNTNTNIKGDSFKKQPMEYKENPTSTFSNIINVENIENALQTCTINLDLNSVDSDPKRSYSFPIQACVFIIF